MQSSRFSKTKGFTLLEVLIALSIFAIIGTASYRVLSTVIWSQQGVESHSEALRQLQRAMLFLSLDMEQAVARSIRGPYADEIPSLVSGQGDYLLQFTRQGWRNPLNLPRSQLQRVAYSLDNIDEAIDEKTRELALLRHYWSVLDQAQDSQPKVQKLMSGVNTVQFRFMDEQGEWHSEWPYPREDSLPLGLPIAIEVLFDTNAYGEIKRLYQIGRVQGEEAKP